MKNSDFLQRVPFGETYGTANAALTKADSNIFSLIAAFRDGAAWEGGANWGWAHFLEHIHFQETDRHASLMELTAEMESLGGRIAAFTVRDMVVYYVNAPIWAMEASFEALSSVISFRPFSSAAIETEKKTVLQEMQRERHNPKSYYPLLFEGLLLGDAPLGRYGLGDEESIGSIDVENLLSYKERYYCRENLFVSAAGRLDFQQAGQLAQRLTDSLPSGIVRNLFPLPEVFSGSAVTLYPFGASPSQVHLMLGWYAGAVQDWIPVTLFANLMGAGFTSLLLKKLRHERRLTYYVTAPFRFYGRCGTFRIMLDLKPEDVPAAVDCVDEVLQTVMSGAVTEEELALAKRKTWGNLVFTLADMYEAALFQVRRRMTGTAPAEPEQIAERLESLCCEDLAVFARQFSREKMKIGLAGSEEALKKTGMA